MGNDDAGHVVAAPGQHDEGAAEGGDAPRRRRWRRWLLPVLAVVLVGAAIFFAHRWLPVRDYLQAFLEWTDGLEMWGPAVVVGVYVVACILFLPGSVITMGAGLVFGLGLGFVTVSVGSTLGACAAFLVGRTVGRRWVADKIRGREKFEAIDEAVAREGFKVVMLIRLSPIFPFNLQNYAFGLTRVKFWKYALASWIGMMPGTVMYVYLGSTARSLAEIAAGDVEKSSAQRVFFWVGLAVTVGVVALVTRTARRAVRRAMKSRGQPAAAGPPNDDEQEADEGALQ